ncbi:hypothetical protein RF55_10214 [Lasius niger]|uniref:Uncharacterized protein n=1 Tax=Lasius niger TaxID=67767 RepID=A0A0J7NBY1_LASNI|nr:hypothetical protein RF55_10214 [Lasius niger]
MEPPLAEDLHNLPLEESLRGPVSRSSSSGKTVASQTAWRPPGVKGMLVTEKGLRHIRRIFGVLQGKSKVFEARGFLEDRPIRILFDRRGDFDVVTTAAVRYPSGDRFDLQRIENPQNIPAYLKAQKHVRVQAVCCHVSVKGRTIRIQPMLLRGQEPCALLGRHSSEKFFLQVARRFGSKLTRRVLLAKGKQLIRQWMETENQDTSQPVNKKQGLAEGESSTVPTRESIPRRNPVSSEEEDTDVISDSDQENDPPQAETSSARRPQPGASRDSSEDDEMSSDDGAGDEGLSLDEILRRENAVKDRIRARLEMVTERRRALDRLKRLRQLEAQLQPAPEEETVQKYRRESMDRSDDLLKLCRRYYEQLQSGTVTSDDSNRR